MCMVGAYGQLDPYKYRLGAGIGYTNYYGDLSPYTINAVGDIFRLFEYNPHYVHDYSMAFSLERRLSSSLGLMLQLGQYDFSMSDRHVNKDGVLRSDLDNFDRSLNFRTQVQDAGLALLFKMDNGKILNKQAFLAPYFTLGAGVMRFQVNGDLLDDQGNWYDYSSRENINNGHFETDLSALETEVPGGYPTASFYANLGFGMRFRLGKALEFFIQSDFRYAGTDYLDDASGPYRTVYDTPFQAYAAQPGMQVMQPENPYRGANNGHNDLYIFHQVGLKFSFIPSRQAFRASRVSPSTSASYEGQPIAHAEMEEQTIPAADTVGEMAPLQAKESGNQYFTFIQINPPDERFNTLNLQVQAAQGDLGVLQKTFEKDQVQRYEDRLEDRLEKLGMERDTLFGLDTLSFQDSLRLEEMDFLIGSINMRLDSARQRRDYLDQSIALERAKTDSLRKLALSPRIEKRDSLSFWGELEQLPFHINRALSQGGWVPTSSDYQPQYSPEASQSGAPPRPPWEDGTPADQTPSYIYQYYPQAPLYREYTPERSGQTDSRGDFQAPSYLYQAPPQTYSDTNEQAVSRGNRFFPLFSPRVGPGRPTELDRQRDTTYSHLETPLLPDAGKMGEMDDGVSADSLIVDGQVQKLPAGPSRPPIDIGDRQRIDTLLLEREILVGLNNSKVEVYFEINQFELEIEEMDKLAPLAEIILNQPQFYLTLAGFADNTGNLNYNLQLVERRVNYVKNLLIEKFGIEASRIATKPGGLLVRGKSPGSRKEDRKVEIMLRMLPEDRNETGE
jgi:outer membrane protein OmpA-like peptidoglycan-associated protein